MNTLVCGKYCVLPWLLQVFSLLLTPRPDGDVWNTVKNQGMWFDWAAAICSIHKHIRSEHPLMCAALVNYVTSGWVLN